MHVFCMTASQVPQRYLLLPPYQDAKPERVGTYDLYRGFAVYDCQEKHFRAPGMRVSCDKLRCEWGFPMKETGDLARKLKVAMLDCDTLTYKARNLVGIKMKIDQKRTMVKPWQVDKVAHVQAQTEHKAYQDLRGLLHNEWKTVPRTPSSALAPPEKAPGTYA